MAKKSAKLPPEPSVRASDPLPKGYRFVPKGNIYITKHCRQQTHEARKTLYVVLGDGGTNKPVGLRCPAHIYRAVMDQHRATARQRAAAVRKRDAAKEGDFEDTVTKLFPDIPREEIPRIVKHALKKHSGRVGRTGTVGLEERVTLAVWAHIRHVHTDYERLLKQGIGRLEAREQVWDRVNEMARRWGGRELRRPVVVPTKGTVKNERGVSPSALKKGKAKGVKKTVVYPPSGDGLVSQQMGREVPGGLRSDEVPGPERLARSATLVGAGRMTRRMLNSSRRVDYLAGHLDEPDGDVRGTVDGDDAFFSWHESTSGYDSSCSEWRD
ncbi:hypothetical protein MMYC01_208143 [Madurella mycetomatis]|uniref:DUF2293 domain-containing protein n=1 Tax=Madurella mycetomatis TaxID=100816 RepID=A0A175VTL1_9PEZI|nr:hypothetical protein MMYC01_208143 [Madurella mycetomatis]